MKKYSGFTLVELLVVVVIVGILAIIAIPRYIHLSSDAKTAVTSSVAASLSSANAVNYVARQAKVNNGIAIANCTDVASVLEGGLPNGYTITSSNVTAGATVSCTVTGPNGTTSVFTASGVS